VKYNVPLLGESCPWYEVAKYAPTNVKWCEAPTCGIISEPANTWSNIVYFVLAYWIYKRVKKYHQDEKLFMYFVPAIAFMGAFSFIYHASYNFFTQWFDFLGMFMMTGLFISLNFNRLNILKKKNILRFYIGSTLLFGLLTVIFYVTYIPLQSLVAVQALFLVGSEIGNRKKISFEEYKPFLISVGLILIAVTFSVLDVTRTMCDPHNHYFQGHAIWHCFSALSLGFAFKFYSQFKYEYGA
jgi:hypothetical protein